MANTLKNKQKNTLNNFFGNILIVLGATLVLSVYLLTNYQNFLPKQTVYLQKPADSQAVIPTSIEITNLTHQIGIIPGNFQDGKWDLNKSQAVYLTNSGQAGKNGNLVIYGHNTTAVLGSLYRAKIGNIVKLTLNDGQILSYKITKISSIPSNDVSILKSTPNQETITIFTCSGLLDSARLAVIGQSI